MSDQTQRAFTLVELMVVIAILGILAAIAIPAYSNYTTKSKFTEVVLATVPTKTAVNVCAASGDCVLNGAISISAGSGDGGTLFVPSVADTTAANAQAIMLAWYESANQILSAGLTPAQLSATAQSLVGQGWVVVDNPSSPGNYCATDTAPTCIGTTMVPASLFNQFYAPNAALAGGNSAALSLPCVGASGNCSPPTKYVASVSYDQNGDIYGTATTSSGLQGETFVLQPSYQAGRVDWIETGTCKTRAGGAIC
jgi:type IV pilus assembly protein PilA